MEVIFMRGLPASGKSTIARQLAANMGALRINLDSLRDMFAQPWSKEHEKFVQKQQTTMALNALRNGQSVIFDNTNLHNMQAKAFAIEAWECGFDVTYKIVDVDVDPLECLIRNDKRGISPTADDSKVVPEAAMKRMIQQFEREKRMGLWTAKSITEALPVVDKYVPLSMAPRAYLVDIDGTLANAVTRGPYDFDKCGEDDAWEHVGEVVHGIYRQEIHVILMSGRDSAYRTITEDWLTRLNISHDVLFMRPEGDKRRDSIIKLELFNQFVRNRYNVLAAIDDRQRVCRMWNQMGIPVLRCGDPDSDF